MKDKTCCFTGHRPEKLKRNETQVKEALERAIEAAVSRGFRHFISGISTEMEREKTMLCHFSKTAEIPFREANRNV